MTDTVGDLQEPVLTPEAAEVLAQIEAATAAAGFPIEGFAKLNAVDDTLVGSGDTPVNLGPTVELTVPIAADGAPLPPPGQRPASESAAAIMIIRVSPERAFGVLCWRAWVNLVEVSSARAFFSQKSSRPREAWDVFSSAPASEDGPPTDIDRRLDEAMSQLTTALPWTAGQAVSEAFGAVANGGHLTVGREWAPPIKRPRYFTGELPSEDRDEPTEEQPPSATPDRASWTSSFVLVGLAATFGLIVGLAILWSGGQADAGDASATPPLEQLLSDTYEDSTQYDRILALRYRDQRYPITLFRTVEADETCSADHVHLDPTETLARSFERPDVGIYDPDPSGCGFGQLDALAPAPYAVPHEQVRTFCDVYHREIPAWLATPTNALCVSRLPDADD